MAGQHAGDHADAKSRQQFGAGVRKRSGRVNPNAPVTVGNPANPAPCNVTGFQSNFQPDQVTAWNLSVQHGFGRNLSLNIAYVGTHGGDLRGTGRHQSAGPWCEERKGRSHNSHGAGKIGRLPRTAPCPFRAARVRAGRASHISGK